MAPRNVLHILSQAQPRGSAFVRIVGSLARHLGADRYHLHAWFLGGDGPLASELQAAGVTVRTLGWARGIRDPRGAWRFWQALRQQAPPFAIVHDHIAGRAARLIVRGTGDAKILLQVHAVADGDGRPVRYSSLATDAVLAVSHAAAKSVDGPARVIYPSAALPPESSLAHPTDSSCVIVGTAGSLVPVKGFTHLIRALGLLRSEAPRIELEIAGEGPLRHSLEREIRTCGLEGRVRFLGWIPDLGNAMRRWDIYVQSSLMEGFGMAALDGMTWSLPVVATSGSGLAELVIDGQTGWLVAPADPAALADRISRLALRPEERRAFGAAGRQRAGKHFSEKQMAAEIQDLYDTLLSLPAGKASSTATGRSSATVPAKTSEEGP